VKQILYLCLVQQGLLRTWLKFYVGTHQFIPGNRVGHGFQLPDIGVQILDDIPVILVRCGSIVHVGLIIELLENQEDADAQGKQDRKYLCDHGFAPDTHAIPELQLFHIIYPLQKNYKIRLFYCEYST
jgi:hypothetical protein